MKNIFYLGCIFLISLNCTAQKYSNIVPDSLILNFVNWDLKNNRIHKIQANLSLVWDTDISEYLKYNFEYNIELNHYLSDADYNYIISQTKDTLRLSWIKSDLLIKPKRIINPPQYKRKKKISKRIWMYSLPLFSIDKSIVIIRKSFDCGYLCDESCLYIYKWKKNKWELLIKGHCVES